MNDDKTRSAEPRPHHDGQDQPGEAGTQARNADPAPTHETPGAEAARLFSQISKEGFPFNRNYRLEPNDISTLLMRAEDLGATTADVRLWYANGAPLQDRPGVLAVFHPVLHKQADMWTWIVQQATALAKELGRWIWLTLGEDRWVRIMVGPDPHVRKRKRDDSLIDSGPYLLDQYITCFDPTGKEHFIGCS